MLREVDVGLVDSRNGVHAFRALGYARLVPDPTLKKGKEQQVSLQPGHLSNVEVDYA